MRTASARKRVKKLTADDLKQYLRRKASITSWTSANPANCNSMAPSKGYVNIPLGQAEKRMSEIPKDRTIVTMCEHGASPRKLRRFCRKNGYKVVGACGLAEYREKGYESVKVPKK